MTNVKENNGVFIGARVLTKNQIKLIVPTFDTIMDQIEELRTEAKRVKEEKVKEKRIKGKRVKENRENSQYNNAIGLFGARGTGKTSTILTIKNELVENEDNIILDTIEPDTFGENTTIMGAIIGILKDQLEEMEKYIREEAKDKNNYSEFFNDCRFKKNNKLRKSYEQMLEAYCYTEGEYRKLLTKDFTDMETFKKKYSEVLKPDIELSKKIRDFYDELIRVKRVEGKNEPMIFLFIDDVDLKTSKCKEIIDAMMKYTCHPNVVCILSGDYEILNESITLSLLESEKLAKDFNYADTEIFKDSKVMDGDFSILDRKKYLTHEYLKKILPPAFRHNVVTWNLSNIPKFSFEIKEDKDKKIVHLYEKISDVLGENSIFSPYGNTRNNDKERETDKGKDNENKNRIELLKTPYNIFDRTPRGLVNVYYSLNKFNERKEQEEFHIFENVKLLVDTIINSSSLLVKHQSKLYEDYIKWGSDEITTSIRFDKIKEELEEYHENKYIIEFKNKNNRKNRKSIEEQENHEDVVTYENLKIILNAFILGHMIKTLLPNAESEGYDDAKEIFMYAIYCEPQFSNLRNANKIMDLDKFKKNYKSIMYYEEEIYESALMDIFMFSDLHFSLKFYELFGDKLGKEDIFESKENLYQNTETAFSTIYDVLYENDDKNIAIETIKKWYKKKYEENGKMKNLIEFLDRTSRRMKGYEITEKIFEPLNIQIDDLDITLYYDDDTLKYMQSPEKVKIDHNDRKVKENIFNTYIKPLWIKKLKDIMDMNYAESIESISNDNKTLYKVLMKLNKNDKEVKLDKYIKFIENKIPEIGREYMDVLKSKFDNEINIENLIEDFKSFYDDEKDGSSSTIYYRTYRFIYLVLSDEDIEDDDYDDESVKNNIDIEEYIRIIDKLNYLAYVTNAKYGVNEARDLLEKIKSKASLELSPSNQWQYEHGYLLNQYSLFRKKANPLLEEEDNLEKKKEDIKKILVEALNAVNEEEKEEIKLFDLELDDMEHDIE